MSRRPGAEPSIDVRGIGTVVVPLRTYGEGEARKRNFNLTLRNVLYAPECMVNIIASITIISGLNLKFKRSNDVESIVMRDTGKVIGQVVRMSLRRKLWLGDQSRHQSSLDPDGCYHFYASWRVQGTERGSKFPKDSQIEHTSVAKLSNSAYLEYTAEEKEFLEKEFGSEYNFLMTLGLRIFDEDDREEGRHTLRTLKADLDDEIKAKSNKRPRVEDSDDNISYRRASHSELAPATYFSDDKYSPEQLNFIIKHYGHSRHFMRCHDLDTWQDSAVDEAIKVVKILMTHERWRRRN